MKTLRQDMKVIALPLPDRAAPAALLAVMACAISLALVASQVVPVVLGA